MPITTGDPLFVPASLQDKAITAAVNLIFKDDPSKLAKSYRLGILPVQLVNEIYCQWAKAAFSSYKDAIAQPYEDCVLAAIGKEMAQDDFNEGRMILGRPRQNPYVAGLQRTLERKKQEHREASAIYFRALNEETRKLDRVNNIFTKEEREAIMDALPDSPLKKIHDAIMRKLLPNKKHFAETPMHEKGVRRVAIPTNNPTCLDIDLSQRTNQPSKTPGTPV